MDARSPKRDGRSAFTVDFADASPHGDVEVRYGLDPVANVWVASFLDENTGEVVKTVPATRVMHQLAELRSHLGAEHRQAGVTRWQRV